MQECVFHSHTALNRRARLIQVALLWLMSCCGAAQAQRLLVVTNALSATREAARVYVHSVDFETCAVLPGTWALPGAAPLAPLLATAQGPALLSTGPALKAGASDMRHVRTWHSAFRMAPLAELTSMRRVSEPEWREWIPCALEDPRNGDTVALVLGVRARSDDEWEARLTTLTYPRREEAGVRGGPATHPLPGWPLTAAHAGGGKVCVLCRATPETGMHVLLADIWGAVSRLESVALGEAMDQPGFAAAGMGIDAGKGLALVVASGYALDHPGGEPVSRACLVRAGDGTLAGASVDLRGEGNAGSPVVYPGGDGLFWVATRVPGTDFAYVTRLRVDAEDELVKDSEFALAGAGRGLLLAPSPDEDALAVGYGNRIEVWRDGKQGSAVHDYPGGIQALAWLDAGLFAGSGGLAFRVDRATAQQVKAILVQSGHVTGFSVIPGRGLPDGDTDGDGLSAAAERLANTSSDLPDSDDDGVPDGNDLEPVTPSPRLDLPAEILFHGTAVGHELRALDFRAQHGENVTWRVEADAGARDWLVITPRSGHAPGQAYLAVNPLVYQRGVALEGRVQVHMTGASRGAQATGSPAEVLVRVLPAPAGARRALYLGDGAAASGNGAEQHGTPALLGLLAGPPFFFSHTVSEGPLQDSLTEYALVILDARAAAQGAVTRQGLLDYVMDGGALLFLGTYIASGETRSLTHWLAPLGIHIDTGIRVDRNMGNVASGALRGEPERTPATDNGGDMPASHDAFLARYWRAFGVDSGCALQAPESCVVVRDTEDPDLALLVACRYGYGRMALLASASPVRGPALDRPNNRLFAEDLFQWLSHAGTDISDMDGDGLPDAIEDANDNGAWDAGETNYLQADTDSDGIPDALEDLNRNGALDDGETDPRNRDSDGDAVYDGADDTPCPAIGSPQILAVEGIAGPAEGPAEGGATVVLSGRNFTPAVTVWFGDRQAQMTRVHGASSILAVTPPCASAQGGTVPVRVVASETQTEAVLADGFRYGPRTRVRLVLTPDGPVRRSGNRYEGRLRVALESPGTAIVRQVVALLRPDAGKGFGWLTGQDSGDAGTGRLFWNMRVLDNGMLMLSNRTPARAVPGARLDTLVPWIYVAETEAPARIRVDVSGLLATHSNGAPLDASSEGTVLVLEDASAPAPTRVE